ncbi:MULTISPECIES: hypothetical protein [Halolamina]|uniref:Uncharacterized protein n=1 Tax=Halolamina pelagica TaxID=699431 RepID=A0A1I5PWQ2_9EURY|nr:MULTISPECIES: hypothetical protein [Halolamina]NHX34989.1 hypothetical protein [Halolamina sp. R1-12]SFP38523.1 hypothetical protein SAMN05216277_103145 [Halolamina pelagica]
MALSRRSFLPLPVAVALAGCTSLTNDAVEMAIENRSGGARDVTATATPVAEYDADDPPDPDFEGTVPPGSRQLVPDVAPSPEEGAEPIPTRVHVVTGPYEAIETLDVTGTGTIDVRITRNGLEMFFAGQD